MSKNNCQETKLYVEGMHCAVCEILIEKTLRADKHIKQVNASTTNAEVTITHKKDTKLDLARFNKKLQQHGYRLFEQKPISKDTRPLVWFANEKIYFHPEKWKKVFQTFGIVGLLLYAFYWLERTGVAGSVMVTPEASTAVYFLFGLVAGASTCAALVGGVLLSLSKTWNEQYQTQNTLLKLLPHGMFHSGRLLAFAFVGGLLAFLGTSIETLVFSAGPFLALVVGVVIVIMGLQLLEVPWAKKMRFVVPKKFSEYATNNNRYTQQLAPFYTGMASVCLPCGMTLTAFIATIAAGNVQLGALNMLAFALGTGVALSAISLTSVVFSSQKSLNGHFNYVTGVLVVFFGLFTINAQLNTLGLPSASDIVYAINQRSAQPAQVLGNQSIQVISMEALASHYSPASFVVKAGVPVRWEINNSGASGCTNTLTAKGLVDEEITLLPDLNVVEFTPAKKGIFKFSCWMGMTGGTIQVV